MPEVLLVGPLDLPRSHGSEIGNVPLLDLVVILVPRFPYDLLESNVGQVNYSELLLFEDLGVEGLSLIAVYSVVVPLRHVVLMVLLHLQKLSDHPFSALFEILGVEDVHDLAPVTSVLLVLPCQIDIALDVDPATSHI